ncbi:hypothetical protein HPP92_016850 [Vanilla planifolia]|uniref:F-box/kelch-repeat protein SKIP6 n=1 Tax=Vanilla planifolia TaxID=51239 RepID=A0A835QBM2_VANPL|nr:hypothetical protein HPP92_016850 [Vanilla planifolia]
MHGSAVIAGKLLAVADRGGVVFDPAAEPEKAWCTVPTSLDLGWRGRAAAVGGVLYSYDFLGKIKGYDMVADKWRQVEGVDKELPKLRKAAVFGVGGKGAWRSEEMEIAIAGIKLSVVSSGGLQGSVEWSESVRLPVLKGSSIAYCISLEI